jgi:hypothetical protein
VTPGPNSQRASAWNRHLPSGGRTGNAEVHQIRMLADVTRQGQSQPVWAQAMAKMRRKTLVTCGDCHNLIHGHPASPPAQ